MSTNAIVVVGLPSSGKTTFLAALWHLIFSREIPTVLSLEGIARGDHSHLNAIADRWLRAQEQERTLTDGNAFVSLNLLDATKQPAQIVFPDVAGEAFSRMWEQRECDPEIAEMLRQGNVLLFVNARRIEAPRWVLDVTTEAAALGEAGTRLLVTGTSAYTGSTRGSSEFVGGASPIQWRPQAMRDVVRLGQGKG